MEDYYICNVINQINMDKKTSYEYEFTQSIKRWLRDLSLWKKVKLEEVYKHFFKKTNTKNV